MDAKERLIFFEKLLKDTLPPLQSISIDGKIDVSNLSEQDLDIIIKKILASNK